MRKEKILITGGAGFIGLHLARRLVEENELVLVDDFSRGRRDTGLSGLSDRVTLIDHDLNQPFPASIPDDVSVVYHLAAVVGVVYANTEPKRVLRTNLLSTINVLDWIAEHPDVRLCFASSSEAYAGTVAAGFAAVPTDETVPLVVSDPEMPRSSYGFSKIAGELLVRSYASVHGLSAVMVRFHNIYGPRMGHEHVVPQLLERSMRGTDPYPVYGGGQFRAFCYVGDAVRALEALVETAEPGVTLVNVGNDQEETRISELVDLVLEITGQRPIVEEKGAPALSPERRVPDIGRLRALTGFEPEVDLRTGVDLTYQWYRANRS